MHARALPCPVPHPRLDGTQSKRGWTTKQAWMEPRATVFKIYRHNFCHFVKKR